MKAKIVDTKHMALHDGSVIRTTLFFKDCPLKCLWCHNPKRISPTAQLAYCADKCVGCMSCVSIYPSGAHYNCDGKHLYIYSFCSAYGACVPVCPSQALTLFGRKRL